MDNVLLAFLFTTFAGLSTVVGSFIAFFVKGENKGFLSFTLGFSAGVMVYVSLNEILVNAQQMLVEATSVRQGSIISLLAFFGGIALIAIIDKFIPSDVNPHEIKTKESKNNPLLRVGLFTAVAISIHNLPEGMASFVSTLHDPQLALPIVFAIAIHNIPEGMAVSIPVYFATGSRKKAFLYTLLSGIAEPLGALLAYFILLPFMSDVLLGVLFAIVAGVMVFISIDELLPSAREYGKHHLSVYGFIMGMLVMALSLLLFI